MLSSALPQKSYNKKTFLYFYQHHLHEQKRGEKARDSVPGASESGLLDMPGSESLT